MKSSSLRQLVAISLLATTSVFSPLAHAQSDCAPLFFNPQDKYPHNTARPADMHRALAPATPLPEVNYKPRDDTGASTLEGYLGKFCTTGMLVLKRDEVVFERYLQGRKPGDSLLSASMSKTILALLIGIAISEEKLALTERVVDVLPDFKDSAFANATVEDLLRMSSGAKLDNSYAPGSESDNRATNPIAAPSQDVRAFLRQKTKVASPPGSKFDYNGAQSALLGAMLRQRVHSDLTSYLEDKLWRPMGAESKAYWIKNYHEEEGVQGQFSATLRDYARLGLLVMERGSVNGTSVVPAAWIDRMVELRRDKAQPASAPFYGLHVWIPELAGGRSFFWGTNGQNIFIDPIAKVVIVHTGNSPNAGFNGNSHLFPLRDAIVKTLSQR